MSDDIRLLIIEDSEDDAMLVRLHLQRSGYRIDTERVDSARGLTEALGKKWDLIIADHSMPHFSGLEALKMVRQANPEIPFIFVSGTIGEETATEAMRVGAQDYLLKTNLKRLVPAVRRELQQAENRRRLNERVQSDQIILNAIGDAVLSADIAGNITYLNLAAEKMTGRPAHEAVGRPLDEVFQTRNAGDHSPSPVLIRRDGQEIPIESSVSRLHDSRGRVTGTVTVVRDVTEARAMALQLTHSALHDVLTGLPNRMLLNDRVRQAIASAARHRRKFAILFLDLDGFKYINDSLGHPIGDQLLRSIGKCLSDCVRASDTVSRQGGDEFVMLLADLDRSDEAGVMARRMLDAVSEAHLIGEHSLHVTASIGLCIYPDDGADAETLIKNADTAMYQAKENGRHCYEFFTPAMNARAVERQSIEQSLRQALKQQAFVLNYQPKINLRSGEITGAEALIRWTDPIRGWVPPAQFIGIAEDCGLIVPIGRWVLREACRQARVWADAGLPLTTMAVNISAREFWDKHFLEGVLAILEETGSDPRYLELELTESVLMKRAEYTESILKVLRAKGVQIAVDDFGTGYSSLSYLTKFSIDSIKIDQSFIRKIAATHHEDALLVSAMIGIGRSLEMRVVAEGVESWSELSFLQVHDCDEAQGYYFSRAVDAGQFARLLGTHRSGLHLILA